MKKALLLGVSTAALTIGALSGASAQSPGGVFGDGTWYVSLFGGVSFPDSAKVRAKYATGTTYTGKAYFKDGFTIGVAAGKEIADRLRGEVELSYTKVKADKAVRSTGASYAVKGHFDALYVMGNLWYDFDMGHQFVPYVGGGLGLAFTEVKASGGFGGGQDTSTEFAFQLGAGFRYPINATTDLDVGYRFRSVPDADYNVSGVKIDTEMDTHNLLATVTFHFSGP